MDGTFRFKTIKDAEFLAVQIANACPAPEKALAISELLINAVEHGNLEISYSEKTEYLQKGIWAQVIDKKLIQYPFSERFVEVKFQHLSDKITVLIIDNGNGFDFHKYLSIDEKRVFDTHSRGIAIANKCLNLQYLEIRI